MILGTAQLGSIYGIANNHIKLTTEKANQILDFAFWHGINNLDTAPVYGKAEKMIGNYHKQSGHHFKVHTKIPANCSSNDIESVVKESLQTLLVSKADTVYFHDFNMCKDQNTVKQLVNLKDSRLTTRVGISINEPYELRYIIENLSEVVDTVQLPFNLLDNARWQKDNLLKKAQEKNISLIARSITLQGLLLQDFNSELAWKFGIEDKLRVIQDLANQQKIEVLDLMIAYVKSQEEITDFVMGFDSLQQLQMAHLSNEEITPIDNLSKRVIHNLSMHVNENIIDPRKWRIWNEK